MQARRRLRNVLVLPHVSSLHPEWTRYPQSGAATVVDVDVVAVASRVCFGRSLDNHE